MNHPSDDPTSCCPTCAGEGTLDAAGFDDWAAVLARDADVRTLDDWAREQDAEWRSAPWPGRVSVTASMCTLRTGRDVPREFDGATPDEARAKAAAWVREQARKAGTDGR